MRKILCSWVMFLSAWLASMAQNRNDVVIDEIMADPSPQVGLPNNEWIELRNTSRVSINLLNWRIGDLNGQSGPLPSFILQPDSFVIICSSGSVSAMAAFGRTLSVTSFPALDNDGDQLFIKSNSGRIIHAVVYSSDWYRNELKKDGGWTLEMIDPGNACAGMNNWKASVDPRGGSPGQRNSVQGINIDKDPPQLLRAYCTDSLTINLLFDEPLDSLNSVGTTHYAISGLSIRSCIVIPPLFNIVQLNLPVAMRPGIIYTVTVSGVVDCKNNPIIPGTKVSAGVPQAPVAGEWIINEVLYNPRPGAYDYVECFNNSKKIFDASRCYIANRNSYGVVSGAKQFSSTPYLVFPGDYIVLTEDSDNLSMQYMVPNRKNVLTISSLPAFPDDQGNVILLDQQGAIIDELDYYDNWQFALLASSEGVALERIDPAASTQDPLNWHSASSTAGYGTPTYKNSQGKNPDQLNGSILVSSPVFSPDNDGMDDILSVQYSMTEPGYVANIIIYNSNGVPVRQLVRNGLMGTKGYWNWDGLNDQAMKLPIGTYIIFTELFNLQGKKRYFKNAVVLARKI